MMYFDYLPSKKLTSQIREIYVLPRECNINLV